MKTKTLPRSHPSRERVLKEEKARCLQLSPALAQGEVHHVVGGCLVSLQVWAVPVFLCTLLLFGLVGKG